MIPVLLGKLGAYSYFLVLILLSIYGLHRYLILFLYWRHRKQKILPPPSGADYRPDVAVQIPIYNEYYVVSRVIRAVERLRYPRDKLEIQILDDSTDATAAVARAEAGRLRREGFNVTYLHRNHREGFKAGALAGGLARTRAELVALFDADFVPPPNFLERVVPYFADPGVGMVQARWSFLNRDYSLLTKVQGLLLDGHFVLEHAARFLSGRFFNFNGTAGVFRRRAIEDAGGWQGDTLTEDLDLSYRAQLAGWRFVYLRDVEVPSELPVDIHGFKSQQHRWAKGSIQVGRKILPLLWRGRVPLRVKFEATFHLTANVCYLLLVVLSALMPLAGDYRLRSLSGSIWHVELPIFLFTTASVCLFYAFSQRETEKLWWGRLKCLPMLIALGIGMCINNTVAVVEALLGKRTSFVRTAKYRIENREDGWMGKIYRSTGNRLLPLEGALALYMALCLALVAEGGSWGALPFVFIFLLGFGYVSGLSFIHGRS